MIRNIRMFIPACGLGERVAHLGIKPHLKVNFPGHSYFNALDRVMDMAPYDMQIEVALPARYGCPPLPHEFTVRFFKEQTSGQAGTILRWLTSYRPPERWVLISNCDNAVGRSDIYKAIEMIQRCSHYMRGVIFTFDPYRLDLIYSYCNVDPASMRIFGINEKERATRYACAGVYLLRVGDLRLALEESDLYLSQALARMRGLYALPAKEYQVWGTPNQILEVEQGKPQVEGA